MRKKILVTGADGFIGSHLVETLVRDGENVIALVQYNSLNSWGWLDECPNDLKGAFEVVAGDVRDYQFVQQAMIGCDAVFHLAALIAIPYSYQAARSYVETNIGGTLNILEAGRNLGVSKIIHTSTSEVYGTAQFVPISENHPLSGQSPYAASKIGADQLAFSYFASHGVPITIVRPFNTYGPRQSNRAVIPTIITQLASGNQNLRLGNIETTRDFNFIQDTVDGFIAALKATSGLGEVFNIGSGYEISIKDTVELIARELGVDYELELDVQRTRPEASEVYRLCCDASKAREQLGWTPKYPGQGGLVRGLKKTADWFLQSDNLSRYKVGIYNV